MPSASLPQRPPRSQALDDLIMGTNNSSIVSKRSVERLYHADEPHYFRYFVKKPQRRAPLINRGYWLRLKAIDVVVRDFLKRPSSNKKVVINLGCGYDVLPWQCHARYGTTGENALFVDVDYPDLMLRKRTMVMETRELRELLGPDVIISKSTKEKVLLRSDKYCQLACDLRELQVFKETLESLVSLDNADVLFVAEVSVTYMDTYSADSLIQWASGIGKAEFCLLEQILPNGPNHPFAKTMLKHFEKLNTPLKSVKQYPTISSQISRFNSRGWQQVDIWDLWEAWEGDDFITSAERIALDDIEPFDEWEELMLFGRHYFVMHAWATTPETPRQTASKETHNIPRLHVNVTPQPASRPVKRRFGNTTLLLNPEGHHYAAHILGLDRDSRSETYDLWSLGHSDATSCKLPLSGPTPRMCSTLTEMGEYGVLLAGGRGSPSKPLSDCWILKKGEGKWTKTWDLPTPLFRHSAVRLNGSSLVLVVGGKTGPSNVSIESFVCHPEKGWLKCEVSGQVPSVFGAVVCNSPQSTVASGEFQGLLCGGMLQDGTMNLKNYWWHLRMVRSQPNLCFSEVEMAGPTEHQLSVFGAEIVDLGYCVAICGGTGSDPSYQGQHITLVSLSERPRVTSQAFPTQDTAAWPFMIGSSVLSNGNQLTILGGGATCFSMGTYWETMPYQLALPNDGSKPDIHPSVSTVCEYLGSPKIVGKVHEDTATTTEQVTVTTITRVRLTSGKTFESLLQADKPVIIEGLNLGTCLQKWTPEYMISAVGAEREIVVHEVPTDSENMDFNSKNFTYVTTSFANLFSRIQDGGRLYLRSLSQTKPSEAPANIQDDFSELSGDFVLPDEIGFVRENVHSSVLRVGGRVNMWLHYDVMANIYTQIQGTKRMILFPPTDVTHLSFPPGASSSSLDVFTTTYPAFTHPHEAILTPGDVLLLPSCWPHTATALSDLSVAVNVFFKDLEEGYATGRDVYGNRDLAAYEKGRADLGRLVRGFDGMRGERRGFYLKRLGDELRAAAGR